MKKAKSHNQHSTPLSTDAPWRSPGSARVSLIKIQEERWVQAEAAGDPGVLLRTMSLPIYQVLETPSSGPDVQYPGNHKRRVIIDEPGGWRGNGRRAEVTGGDRLKEGNMECGMNLHRIRED